MWIWEWRCCGNLWELIPSRRYPERNESQPVCPACGRKPVRKWVRVPSKGGSSGSPPR